MDIENMKSTAAADSELDSRLSPHERSALRARRTKTGVAGDAPVVGLALSGGGIRSATFCLGLIRGLAQNGLLSRFDYLSTVSGGGYIGAAIGRLIAHLGIDQAQQQLAAGSSSSLSWLRRYGRYLAPSGARDLGIGAATYLRAAIAVHFELAVLCILIACFVVLPHAWQLHSDLFKASDWTPSLSVWWPFAGGLWLLLAPGLLAAYWGSRDPDQIARKEKAHWFTYLPALLIALALCWASWKIFYSDWGCRVTSTDTPRPCGFFDYFSKPLASSGLRLVGLLVLVSVVAGTLLSLLVSFAGANDRKPAAIARFRRGLTEALRAINLFVLALFAMGTLDRFTWDLRQYLYGASWLVGGTSVGGLLVILSRSLFAPLQQISSKSDRPRLWSFNGILGILGLLAALAILIGWTTLVQGLVFPLGLNSEHLWRQDALRNILIIAAVCLGWIALTSMNRESTNSSSLHSFYRARLSRAYLRIGNPDFHQCPPASRVHNVKVVAQSDDVPLAAYTPDRKGGPIHLINACLNQTRSRLGRVYNADRKGHRLTVSYLGFEIGETTIPTPDAKHMGSLGEWTAVSGAAASPGAGSYTSMGWALLLFMGGVRLGRWFPSFADASPQGSRWERFRHWSRDLKFGRLASEAIARFGGASERSWYVSDGGHFENTAAHALIRREVDFILLADCGADPDFSLADLENLVRKSRIDFDAEIEFYSSEGANLRFTDQSITVLSRDELRLNFSKRGALLGRITYRRGQTDAAQWKQGTILVIKPNLHELLDADILAYASRNPAFPQQSTGDQFFDEAQWESYQRLGEDFGRALTPQWLRQLPSWDKRVPIGTPVAKMPGPDPIPVTKPPLPFWRRETKAAALGATLGIGALGAVILPAWQAIGAIRDDRNKWAIEAKNLSDEATAAAPAWAREVRPPTDAELSEKNTDARSLHLSALYTHLVSRRANERDRISGVRLISTIQDACGISRASGRIKQTCHDSEGAPQICELVCERKSGDSYWIELIGASSVGAVALRDPGPRVVERPDQQQDMVFGSGKEAVNRTMRATVPPELPTVQRNCKAAPVDLYVQVYDEATRDGISKVPWSNAYVRVPGIENVVATAAAKGRPSPYRWPKPTLVIHNTTKDGECTRALATWLAQQLAGVYGASTDVQLRELPSNLQSSSGTVELWLPPKKELKDAQEAD